MPRKIDLSQLIEQHLRTLEALQAPSGLFRASAQQVDTGYDKAWLRDNFYECLPFVLLGRWDIVQKTYTALLKILHKYEWKIDHAIAQKPRAKHEYIHARYHPDTFSEFWEDWGNKQNDAIGSILFMLGHLYNRYNVNLLQSADNIRIVQKLVNYLETLEYWHDQDSGVWEESEEVHASSVGACVAGLKEIQATKLVIINNQLIDKGLATLRELLPRESGRKFVDMALLSLIYPYNIVSDSQKNQILENIEYYLVREKGVIRYKNDYYYNKNTDGFSQEAEWCFGLSWLALIYSQAENKDKARHYLEMAFDTINDKGEVPELYYSNSDEHNTNSPLGWSESMFILAVHAYQLKHYPL